MSDYVTIQERAKIFAVQCAKFCCKLEQESSVCRVYAIQLARASSSIGANAVEATCAESNKDYIHKLKIALKEAKETEYWIQVIVESGLVSSPLNKLSSEIDQIIRILITMINKRQENLKNLNS